jgi:hypothetical protein
VNKTGLRLDEGKVKRDIYSGREKLPRRLQNRLISAALQIKHHTVIHKKKAASFETAFSFFELVFYFFINLIAVV